MAFPGIALSASADGWVQQHVQRKLPAAWRHTSSAARAAERPILPPGQQLLTEQVCVPQTNRQQPPASAPPGQQDALRHESLSLHPHRIPVPAPLPLPVLHLLYTAGCHAGIPIPPSAQDLLRQRLAATTAAAAAATAAAVPCRLEAAQQHDSAGREHGHTQAGKRAL